MSLIEQIEADYKTAFKARHQVKVDMLRLLKSELKNAEIAARHNLNDEEVIAVMTREAKRRRDSIASFQQGGRQDLVDRENAELQELMYYLPTQFSDSELADIVTKAIAELKATPKDFGRVMGAVIKQVKGQADGARVAAAVKAQLR